MISFLKNQSQQKKIKFIKKPDLGELIDLKTYEVDLPEVSNYGRNLAFGNGKFVTIGGASRKCFSSTNGITWSEENILNQDSAAFGSYSSGQPKTLRYLNNRFFITFDFSAHISYLNNINLWRENPSTNLFNNADWNDVGFFNNKYFVSCGPGISTVVRVGDFVNDSTFISFGFNAALQNQVRFLTGNDKILGVTYQSSKYSLDGVNWNNISYPESFDAWLANAYGNGIYIIFGYYNKAMISADGINFQSVTLPVNGPWNSAVFDGEKFIAVAENSNQGIYSFDGVNWNIFNMPAAKNWNRIVYGNGKLVAIADETSNKITVIENVYRKTTIKFS